MNTETRAPLRFFTALRFWHRLGWLSFGGPAGQIAMMHEELVQRQRWISERRFLHALNYCMVLPGPEAQQLATYIGWLMHGTRGGVAAGVLFVLPALLVLIVLSWLYMAYGQLPLTRGVLYLVKPVVLAIVLQAAWRIGSRTLHNHALRALALAAFALSALGWLPFPALVGLAALCGWLGGRLAPAYFQGAGGHASKAHAAQGGPAPWIDDDTPPPAHARFAPARLLRLSLVCGLLWAAPLALLTAYFGWQHDYPQMAWFFTKAALLTFGGAYAVLPYVYQGAVLHYGWLAPQQMMDGLALGESTPGPLIIVVAFVGFVGGYGKLLLGAAHPLAAGVLAACLVTWLTFLPSFFFILAGGPLVERSRDDLQLQAPLRAISAAVVGVILNLACFFALHLLWPARAPGAWPDAHPDWLALGLSVAALLALLRFGRSVLQVLLLAALAGVLLSLAGWQPPY